MPQDLYKIIDQEIDPAFADRARSIISEIIKKKPKLILDAGCGRGYYIKLVSLLEFPQEIIGIDINENYLKIAAENCQGDKRVKIKKGSIYSLPFPDNYFDFIICSEVLEHLADDKLALKELHRVMKKGGTMIVTVPNKNFPLLWDPLNWILMKLFDTHVPKHIWWLAGIWADHERLYTKEAIINIVRKQFRVIHAQSIIFWCWPFSHFLLYGLGKNLVEMAGFDSFSRFNVEKKGWLNHIIVSIFRFPGRLLVGKDLGNGVGIIIKAAKT